MMSLYRSFFGVIIILNADVCEECMLLLGQLMRSYFENVINEAVRCTE